MPFQSRSEWVANYMYSWGDVALSMCGQVWLDKGKYPHKQATVSNNEYND